MTALLHNMGGPFRSRETFTTVPLGAYLTVFNLSAALAHHGVLGDVGGVADPLTFHTASCKRRWGGDLGAFWRDLGVGIGIGPKDVDERAASVGGCVIGLHRAESDLGTQPGATAPGSSAGIPLLPPETRLSLCTDLVDVLVMLGRRVGNLVLPRRPAEYTWARLFDGAFCTADLRYCPAKPPDDASRKSKTDHPLDWLSKAILN